MLFPLLLLLLLVGATTNPGVAVAGGTTTGGHLPPLIDCAPAPGPEPSSADDGAFRENLASALAALPATAATGRDGFAAVARSRGGSTARAFVRGLCFDVPGPNACVACLSAAARDVRVGCGGHSRRAGAWRAGCFLAYADTDASSAREDAFRGWLYTVQNTSQGGGCAGDRTAADCDRCFEDSRRAARALGWLPRIRGEEVVVVGYTCCLRVQISHLPQGPDYESTQSLLWVWIQAIAFLAALIIIILTFLRILEHLWFGN